MSLHGNQQSIYDLIKDDPNISTAELMKRTDISTPSLVHHHLNRLQVMGYIRKGDKWEILEK